MIKNQNKKKLKSVTKNYSLFLADLGYWLVELVVYFWKKSKKTALNFLTPENLKKNKVVVITFLVVIFFLVYFFQKYRVVFIAKDESEQSAGEKSFLRYLQSHAGDAKASSKSSTSNSTNKTTNSSTKNPTSNPTSNPANNLKNNQTNNQAGNPASTGPGALQGKVKNIQSEKITITTKVKDEVVIVNEKTKITPQEVDISEEQQVTVNFHKEGDALIADGVVISPIASGVMNEE